MRYSLEEHLSTDFITFFGLVREFYSFRALYGFIYAYGEGRSRRF